MLVIPIPWLVARAIDTALPRHDHAILGWCVAGVLTCAALSMLASVGASSALVTVTREGTAALRSRCTELLVGASRQFHTDADEAVLHDMFVTDAARVDEMASVILSNVVPALLTLIAMAAALIIVNGRLALVTALLLPLVVATHLAFRRPRGRAVAAFQRSYEQFASGVLHVLRSDESIRVDGLQQETQRDQDSRIHALKIAGRRSLVLNAAHDSAQLSIVSLVAAIILFVGGGLVIDGSLKIGELVSFYAAFGLLRRPIAYLAAASGIVHTGSHALSNIDTFLSTVDTEPYGGTTVIDAIQNIELRDVSFQYPDRAPITQHVSLRIDRGECVGLAGPNGTGKSTLVHLVLGLYRPTGGGLFVNSTCYEDIDIRELRSRIAVVTQHPVFLNTTIGEYLQRQSIDADTQAILDRCDAGAVIDASPHGLATMIGDDGIRLSGGQRQRLAIARALLRNPDLLILDEPTLHLDATTIAAILAMLRTPSGPGVLVVSHQPEVLAHADRVLTLDLPAM